MSGLRQQVLLGVDAGGTKTNAVVATTHEHEAESASDAFQVLGRGSAGTGNPNRCGAATAYSHVADAMQAACEQAGVEFDDIGVAVIGMAGAGTESKQQQAATYLKRQTGITQLRVIPDYKLVLPAAFRLGNGVAVVAGTGSIVHGVRGDNEVRVGGRGYLIDDCGSGFWIGRQALRAMVYFLDGRGPKTALTQLICQSFQEPDPANIVAMVHGLSERLSEIAALAPLVVEAARCGDVVASEILDRAADELKRMISAACGKLGYAHAEYSLALAGSVLSKTNVVREKLVADLQRGQMAPKSCQIVTEPVLGAIRLGQLRTAP